ncbi:hypothetical protein [Streptomyces sp. GMR22]|uniref:hypothetical protein n=1 Tax=Streptomyces sp. GMR22 TaxID=2759524 RepID=UPI0015F9C4EA|nr:hypothetical protein [Streptomyces sp. GMR22]MBA6439583.1 hypothetical protein [Streptomyces sp. GMR22]
MQIGKKVALMAAAAAGTMVVGGAGSASAHGLSPHLGGAAQLNSCDTNAGAIAQVGGMAPTREVNVGADCVNFTNRDVALQANDCDTTTGAIAQMGGASPTGNIEVGANCANIAVADDPVVVVHQDPPKKHHKAKDPHKAKKHHKAKSSHKAKDPHKVTKHHKAKVKAKKKDCKH